MVDKENHKIYIRSEDKEYFDNLIDNDTLLEETNINGKTIAYYLLKDYPENAEFISLNDILTKPECSLDSRLQVIEKIFCKKYYNVLYDKCFIKVDNTINLINNYSNKDSNIVWETIIKVQHRKIYSNMDLKIMA